jgi:hypothetical protein
LWNDHQFGYTTKIEKNKPCLPPQLQNTTQNHTQSQCQFLRTQKEQHTVPCSYKSTLGQHILFPFPKERRYAGPAEMSDVLLPHPWSKSLRKKQAALAGEALS